MTAQVIGFLMIGLVVLALLGLMTLSIGLVKAICIFLGSFMFILWVNIAVSLILTGRWQFWK